MAASRSRGSRGSRKDDIVRAVLRLVAERGVDGVSAQLIADQVGLSQPGIFRHFASKEQIWLAVMDWLEDRLVSITVVPAAREPVEELRRIFLGHTALVREHPALAKILFSDQLRLDYPALKERFAAIHARYSARLEALIDGARAGAARMPTSHAAAVYLALVQGYAFQTAIARTAADPERLPAEMFEMFRDGLLKEA